MICVGTDLETSRQGIELAQKHENIWASVGLHPNDIEEVSSLQFMVYSELIEKNKVIAVGEIGLDYYRTPELEKQERQKEVFKQFLDLAVQHNKPVVLHARDAGKGSTGKVHSDMLEILISVNRKLKTVNSPLRGVAHSFTGSSEDAKKYIELGFYLGFNGIITFARQYDDIVRETPLEKILLETDAPFLTPEPYRGKRNEPAYVIEVAKKIAELKNESLEKVIEQTTQNCKKLFGLI